MKTYELAIVGAGSAGVWAAPFAARLGASVALIEKERIGGDCTHLGCVPSKALLKAAQVAQHLRHADEFGFDPVQPTVDLRRVMAGVREAIDHVYAFETPQALADAGVDVYLGGARFEDSHTLIVGEQTRIRAEHILLCTGAGAVDPAIPGLAETPHWTYASVWQQEHLPQRLLVLGSGPVGIELTQAFARLGSAVTILERGDRPLKVADPEASSVLRRALEDEGVQFRIGARVDRVLQHGNAVVLSDRGEDVEGDALLVAVGRRPVVKGLDLEQAGVAYTERGIQVDEHLRTSQKHIFACGDVIGSFQFTHYAAWQASMAIRTMLLPGSSKGVLERVPWTVFTEPEVAQCGLTEDEARRRYADREVCVARWPLERLDRAVTDHDRHGFVKIVHRPNGQILGAQIVSARAGEMIAEIALAIDHNLKLGDVAATLHVYPTYAIGVQQLAAAVRLRTLSRSAVVKLVRRVSQSCWK
ncbi:MAG: FAD-dependent oxidoreductase [Chloroflexota bacterium]|nr:FAD-dependent oxidoreductase [Chloroflexota bacterium]